MQVQTSGKLATLQWPSTVLLIELLKLWVPHRTK
jgi:hypothetical protein